MYCIFASFFVRRIFLITISTYGENCILRAYRVPTSFSFSSAPFVLSISVCLSGRCAIISHETTNFSEIAEATDILGARDCPADLA